MAAVIESVERLEVLFLLRVRRTSGGGRSRALLRQMYAAEGTRLTGHKQGDPVRSPRPTPAQWRAGLLGGRRGGRSTPLPGGR